MPISWIIRVRRPGSGRRSSIDPARMTLDEFSGINAGYVLELYERFRADPQSVDEKTRALFATWTPTELPPADRADGPDIEVAVAATNLVESIRRYGHLAAQLDPLGTPPLGDPSLSTQSHGITDDDLKALPASLVGGVVAENSPNAFEAIEKLRRVYCSSTGFDYAHVFVPEEREWLRSAAESGRFLPPMDPESCEALLDGITQVDVFERFLHRTFPGKTRFSIEGLDMLVPMLDEIMAGAAGVGTRHMLVGMAHRGRLNVLAHVLDKPYAQILAEFKDPVALQTLEARRRLDGRREIPRRRLDGRAARPDVRDAGAEPQPPRSRESRGRRHGEGGRHRRGHQGRAALRRRQDAAGADSRRHGVPGSGHRGRNAEPVAPARLPHRRHAAHHRQQPAGLHRHSRRFLQHQLRERPGARLQDPHRPRERGRPGGVPGGGAAGVGISGALPARLPDRPRGLPAIRPQRGRRAGLHAARDVSRDRVAPHGAGAVCAHAGGARHGAGKRRRGPGEEALPGPGSRLRVAEAGGGLRGAAARSRFRRVSPA